MVCMHIFELTHKVTSVEMLKSLRKYVKIALKKQTKKKLSRCFYRPLNLWLY